MKPGGEPVLQPGVDQVMRRNQKFANPFYGLLLVAGITFVLTATAYGVMAFRDARPAGMDLEPAAAATEHPLMAWMSRHGEAALICQLTFLAVCTFGAIGTDDYWQRRAAKNMGSRVVHRHAKPHR
jgi:hypothetical protein